VLLEVSQAAYYAHRAAVPSARQRADEELTEHIRQAYQASKGRYGAPRIHAELRRRGHRHARKRVARLIRAAGFCGRTPRRWKPTTIPDPAAAARALVQVVGDGMGASIQALLGQVLVQLDDLVLNRSAASSAIRSPGASISASRWRTSIPRRPAPPGPPSAGCREPDSASEARDRRRANDRHPRR
jgi:transposase InsO family protein